MYTADKAFNYSTVSDGNGTTSSAATPTIYIQGSLSTFGGVIVSTSSAGQGYTVYGSNLTGDITVTAPSQFEVSTDSTNYFSSRTLTLAGDSVPHTRIHARFSPTTTGAKSGTITHTSSGATEQDQAVSGNGIKAEPTLQATSANITLVGADTMTVGWTRGNGDSCIVLARATSDLSSDPVDGIDYAASAAYAGGTAIGGGYVMYKGTGTSVKLTGLGGGTTYYARVYEYNSDGSNAENYLSTSPASANATTGIVPFVWNQTGSADWTVGANWTPARGSPSPTDVLQFSGGGTVTATNIPTQTIAQLLLSNNSTVNLQASGATLTIAGGIGTDLDVPAGSALNINGATALTISLGAGATGSISGTMVFSGNAHKLNANDASGIIFNSGSSLTQGASCSGNIFTAAGTANAIVFANGSTFEFHTGSNPFALTAPSSKVVFQTGSLYRHKSNGSPSLSGRTYANFEYDTTAILSTIGAGGLKCDNFTVTSGTFNVNNNIDSIRGNISVASGATLTFTPATAGHLNLTGTSQQSITNGGTLTFAANCAPVLNNATGLALNSDVTFNDTLFLTSGALSIGAHTLTLNGQFSRTSGSLVGGATSNLVIGGSGGTLTLPAVELNDFTVNRGSDTVATGGDVTVHNNLTLTSGFFTPRASTGLTVYNPLAGTADNYVPDTSSYLTVLGTSGIFVLPASCAKINSIQILNANGLRLSGDLTMSWSGSLTLGDCPLDANGHILSYHPDGGQVRYVGVNPQVTSDAEWPSVNSPRSCYINNPSGVTLHASRTLFGDISFDAGIFNTGSNVLTLDNASLNTFDNTTYITGNLRTYIPGGYAYFIFQSGTSDAYSPLTIEFNNVTAPGYLTCETKYNSGGYPSAIDPLSSAKRYWNLRKDGGLAFDSSGCTITVNYQNGDFNTNFTLAAEDTMKCGCRYDDDLTKNIKWDFFPVTRDQANNNVTMTNILPQRLGATGAGADFVFGAGYGGFTTTSWTGVNDKPAPALPKVFALSKPYPNPASGRASLSLSLPDARHVRLEIFNMLGQKVTVAADRAYPAGVHQLNWDLRGADGGAVTGGVYFYRLQAGDKTMTGRLTVLR